MRRLAVAIDEFFCDAISDCARGRRIRSTVHFTRHLASSGRKPVSNMATEDCDSRQVYITNAISLCGPVSKEGFWMDRHGISKLPGLQGVAAAFLYTHTELFWRPSLGTHDPASREHVLAIVFPRFSRELEILPSGINIDTCKALEILKFELSTVHKDQWTASVLVGALSSAERDLVRRTPEEEETPQGEEVDNQETAVYDLLNGVIYGSPTPLQRGCGEDDNGKDHPLPGMMGLLGKEETMERMRAAQEAIWDHLVYKSIPKRGRKKRILV